MKRTLLLALAALLAIAGLAAPAYAKAKQAAAPQPKVTAVKVLEFGVYTSTVEKRENSPTIADGIKDRAKDFKLVRKSTLVDASLGIGIGMKYVLRGTPKGAAVNIDVVVRHPRMVNPDTGEAMTESSASFERVIGTPEYAVWSFDTPEGLVPGEYVIELALEGKVLASKVFRVKVRE
ncbi:MAG: DUF3859 domain-containing protein [Humidesulfovibrio sp.]|uniref:DUF3859 domain-containing protein n=1 Tax=Humidesulfovibrio sp. TaxID=2910988 RepID=UPI0027F4BDC9|nr:DUF3859 domain-containing protein [Humidesulfovibrio sp.]MDQ7836512.1 DUF3859 domain-containing protein [Humidesulfovibrio sp.]